MIEVVETSLHCLLTRSMCHQVLPKWHSTIHVPPRSGHLWVQVPEQAILPPFLCPCLSKRAYRFTKTNTCLKRFCGETTREGFLEGVQDKSMREVSTEIYLNPRKVYEIYTVPVLTLTLVAIRHNRN